MNVADRFEAFVSPEPNSGCWLWTGAVDSLGYGMFWMDGRSHRAHRVGFVLAGNTIQGKTIVMHRCDNPGCVNPQHLTAGTHKDNTVDAYRKGRRSNHSGSRHGNAKFTEQDVLNMRDQYAKGASLSDLARDFSTSTQAVFIIVKRKGWTHI